MSKQATCPICGAEQRDHLVCWLCVGRHRRTLSQISDLWGHLIEAVRRDTNLNVRVGVKSVGSEKPLHRLGRPHPTTRLAAYAIASRLTPAREDTSNACPF